MLTKTSESKRVIDDIVFVVFIYNQERYLHNSILSAINQTCLPSKLIIMDDASTDGSDAVIKELLLSAPKELCIDYQRNSVNIGLVSQMNKLVGAFNNKLIVVQAGDDESYPFRLEETYSAWVSNNRPSIVLAGYDRINDQGEYSGKLYAESKKPKPVTLKRLINRKAIVSGCSVAIDSDLFNYFGPINTNVVNEDRVNAFRAYFRKGIFHLDKSLLKYRYDVGISAFNVSTREERFKKIGVEAKREIADIENHLLDLMKIDGSGVETSLSKRKKGVEWCANISINLTFFSALAAAFQGVGVVLVLKTYKRLNRGQSI